VEGTDSDERGNDRRPGRQGHFLFYLLIAALAGFWVRHLIQEQMSSERMSYTDFKALVAAGKVSEVAVDRAVISLRPKSDALVATVVRVEDPHLLEDLQRAGVKVTGVVESAWLAELMSWGLPVLLLVGYWAYMNRRVGQGGPSGALAIGRSKAKIYMEKAVGIRFSDVAGVDEAKNELAEVVEFLRDPDRFGRLGAHIPKGVLLVGPPGTGKTLLARAVAGEAGVPFFSISGSEFVELFVGVGAARVRDLFEQGKKKAPCIVFIDELDALGKVRGAGPMAHEEREQTLNQLLVEMDGFDASRGIILMAATNRPEILDPALLRAGRFDRHVLVDRPDKAGRLAILRLHARKIRLAADADLDTVANLTAGFAGAELANIINEAALLGVRHGKARVERAELEEAVERVIAGLEKRNRVLTAAEKNRVAHHEIGHALVALSLPGTDQVRKISIIPRGISALGYTLQVPTEDRFLMAKSELEDKIAVLLGGRAAELLVFGEVSTGAQDDLAKATEIARNMVKAYGMSERLGARSFTSERSALWIAGNEERRGDYSDATARAIDAEVAAVMEAQARRTTQLLDRRRAALLAAAARLLAAETMTGDELRAVVDSAPAEAPVPLKAV
jgi:cell division protease FtsH